MAKKDKIKSRRYTAKVTPNGGAIELEGNSANEYTDEFVKAVDADASADIIESMALFLGVEPRRVKQITFDVTVTK